MVSAGINELAGLRLLLLSRKKIRLNFWDTLCVVLFAVNKLLKVDLWN